MSSKLSEYLALAFTSITPMKLSYFQLFWEQWFSKIKDSYKKITNKK